MSHKHHVKSVHVKVQHHHAHEKPLNEEQLKEVEHEIEEALAIHVEHEHIHSVIA